MKKITRYLTAKLKVVVSKGMLYFLGIGAVSFVFEACYGTPQASDLNKNFQLKGKLLTTEGKPASNVTVSAFSSVDSEQAVTRHDGSFTMNINGHILEKVKLNVIGGNAENIVVLPANAESVEIKINHNN